MSLQLTQQPYLVLAPGDTPTIFTASAPSVVTAQTNVKFLCEVYVHRTYIPISSNFPVATLKTSPNAAGVGIFDLEPVLSAYINCSFEGRRGITTNDPNSCSTFKNTQFESSKPHSIHQIDRFCTNEFNMNWYQCRFRIEYLNTSTGRVEINDFWDRESVIRLIYNGVLTNTNPLTYYNDWYYSDPQDVQYEDGSGDYLIRGASGSALGGRFISNMPEQQYITENDYGTVAFFNCIRFGPLATNPSNNKRAIEGIALRFYDAADATVQMNFYSNVPANGGKDRHCNDLDASSYWIYFGHGLANMKGRNETWPANSAGYEVYASSGVVIGEDDHYESIGRKYRFDIIPEDCKGYESVRLVWQNRLGAWDYYTFTKKSIKRLKTKRKNYQQLEGTWNEAVWRPKDHLGGMKVFDVKATESLTLNTDYVDNATAAWLEELFTSSQVYIINKFSATNPVYNFGALGMGFARYIHKYTEPVIVTSSKYTKKTKANDGLIKYTLTIDKSKAPNIQRA